MILLGKIGIGIVGTALAGAGILCSEGTITVNVKERQPEQHHVFVMVPALLVPVGMHFVPKEHLAKSAREIQPWMPTIRAALDELRDGEDITFVEVQDGEQHVRVAKDGGSIVVDVNDPNETVHVSTPIRAISGAIEELAAASPAHQP